jgi:hypothetical protein
MSSPENVLPLPAPTGTPGPVGLATVLRLVGRGTPRRPALNELRVNLLLGDVPPPVAGVLLHLQMWRARPHLLAVRFEGTLAELLKTLRGRVGG